MLKLERGGEGEGGGRRRYGHRVRMKGQDTTWSEEVKLVSLYFWVFIVVVVVCFLFVVLGWDFLIIIFCCCSSSNCCCWLLGFFVVVN